MAAAERAAETAAAEPESEGRNAKFLGRALAVVVVFSALVCVVLSGFDRFWVVIAIASTLNGLFFAYLLSKVGSILVRLEALAATGSSKE